ncbi:MAG: ZIP family metal transporter [Gammaproteobacteria bacterium]|nr:ZIP family metal transporter [Gammaproteobacteria bacterium]
MSTLVWILSFTLLGGLLSTLAASIFLVMSAGARGRLLPHLISFATGALLGAAFLGLLPHAIDDAGLDKLHAIGATVLGGILIFFLLEKLVLWRHCHLDECEAHGPQERHRAAASGTLILVGDGIHNLLDGMLIAAAFLTDVHLGIVTALAVIAHEIPQEVGDLAVLLNGGMSRGRALLCNLMTGLAAVAGGVLAYFWFEAAEELQPYVLAVAASSFLYVAVADLIPGLHRRIGARSSLTQIILIGAGVGVIYATHSTLH